MLLFQNQKGCFYHLDRHLAQNKNNLLAISANSLINRTLIQKLKQPEESWRDLNIDEIQVYFALLYILMAQVKNCNVSNSH